jgi:hypothetical protein
LIIKKVYNFMCVAHTILSRNRGFSTAALLAIMSLNRSRLVVLSLSLKLRKLPVALRVKYIGGVEVRSGVFDENANYASSK